MPIAARWKWVERGDQPAGDDAVVQDAARPVDVGEERLEGPHPLRHARLDGRPLVRGEDAGHQVEGERPLLARQGEGDALVAERHVAGGAAGGEVGRREGLEGLVEGGVGGPGAADAVEHLVPSVAGRVVVEKIPHRADRRTPSFRRCFHDPTVV